VGVKKGQLKKGEREKDTHQKKKTASTFPAKGRKRGGGRLHGRGKGMKVTKERKKPTGEKRESKGGPKNPHSKPKSLKKSERWSADSQAVR